MPHVAGLSFLAFRPIFGIKAALLILPSGIGTPEQATHKRAEAKACRVRVFCVLA